MLMADVFAAQFCIETIGDDTLLNAMLASPPVGAGFTESSMWDQMSPLTVELLEEYFAADMAEAPMLDWSRLEYAEWSQQTGPNSKIRYYGTRQKDSKELAGVIRMVVSGTISEGSFDIGVNENGL